MLVSLIDALQTNWKQSLLKEVTKKYFIDLDNKITVAYNNYQVFPKSKNIFRAFSFFNIEDTKIVILGQDPYHGENQANGLSFAVNKEVKTPPSLNNIFKELVSDLNVQPPSSDLITWAEQGILLLNTTLTVQAHKPLSHELFGWKELVTNQLKELLKINSEVIFILWGKVAQNLILPLSPKYFIKSAHPSFYSAAWFFGSKPFSKANQILKSLNKKPINW